MSKRDLRKELSELLMDEQALKKQKDCSDLTKFLADKKSNSEAKQDELKKLERKIESQMTDLKKSEDELGELGEKLRDMLRQYLNEKGLPESYLELAASVSFKDLSSIIKDLEETAAKSDELLYSLVEHGENLKQNTRGKII